MLTALRDQVIVEIELRNPSGETDGGILIAEAKLQGLPQSGTVYSVGEGVDGLVAGDKVIYKEMSPSGFRHDGLKLLRLHKDQIIGVSQ